MVELIALGLLIAFGAWALRQEKKLGKTENKLDNAEAHINAVDESIKKARKREKEIAALSLADKRKRLSK